ncbi:MAG TPA: uracil-DNA glycosylase [Terrimesophilobacter sp.]|nr:uracil-DNA glycosylase [Terrimesophilobacter sp.]
MSTPRPLPELVEAGWARALEPVADTIAQIGQRLRADAAEGKSYLPAGANVLRAFTTPFDDVRVLIVGQDPYPTPGHAVGLAFSVDPAVRPIPRSLQNIYRELHDDVGITPPAHGDLSAWARSGVLLLNRVLTVRPGASGSHRGLGWEKVTEHAIRCLAARDAPLVSILWGRDAGTLEPLLNSRPVIRSAHPSPLSASGGFFGSRPFSRANDALRAQESAPVDWTLDP